MKTLYIIGMHDCARAAHLLALDLGESFGGFRIVNAGAKYSESGEFDAYNRRFIPADARRFVSTLVGEDDGSRMILLSGTGGGLARWVNRYTKHLRIAQPSGIQNIADLQQSMINNGIAIAVKSLSREDILEWAKAYLRSESSMSADDRWLAIKLMTHDSHPLKFRFLMRHFRRPFRSKLVLKLMRWYCGAV